MEKKKPFYLRWWFITLAVIVIIIFALSRGNAGEKNVGHEGDNTTPIQITTPVEKENDKNPSTDKQTNSKPTTGKSSSTKKARDEKSATDTGMDSKFKAAMDSYEEFVDEYVNFMKKYKANPNDLGLLSDYSDYMSKYADVVKKFEKWEDANLNTQELNYYIKVQTRVSKKLLKVAQ